MPAVQPGEDRQSFPWGLILGPFGFNAVGILWTEWGERSCPGDPVWDPGLKEEPDSVQGAD